MIAGQSYIEKAVQNISYPAHAFATTSPRKILFGLNLILAICGLCIITYGVSLTQLLYDPNFTSGWINWLTLAVIGFCLMVTAIIGMRGAHLVSLELLLTYFWCTIVLFAPLIFGLFTVFNISFYTRIFLKHEWEGADFLQIRKIFCNPSRTATNKCIAPLVDSLFFQESQLQFNQTFNSTVTWCIFLYNATDCESIRNEAISDAVDWSSSLIIADTIIGATAILLMAVSIYISVQILTEPVITQSMLDVINYLLTLPIAGCIGQAVGFWWIQDLDIDYTWLPVLYMFLAVAQVVALPLGIIAGKLKSRILLSAYITLIVLILCGMAVAVGVGWTLAKVVAEDYDPDDETKDEIACRKHMPGCSGCELDVVTCAEWTEEEVLEILSIDFRMTGIVSGLCILYLVGALTIALLVEKSLKNYKSDFV